MANKLLLMLMFCIPNVLSVQSFKRFHARSIVLVTDALLKRGYSKKDIKKILGQNLLRVFKANQPG
ncbi:MAG: membrane dipeptidase [Ferruginibacter sp.]